MHAELSRAVRVAHEISRRSLLRHSSTCALAAWAGTPLMARASATASAGIGLQLYTLRKPLSEDFTGTLQKVAAMGYTQLEFAGYHDHGPAQVAAILRDLDLQAPSAHISMGMLEDGLDDALDAARTIGHHYLVVPWLAPWKRIFLSQYRSHAELLNRAGERCREAGIQLAYHNHDFEFRARDGKRPYDVLLQETAPDLVSMELDLFWIHKAGQDPLAYFASYPGRFSLCHVKDMTADGTMTDVGRGVIDYAQLLPAARKAGIRYFFVEHDDPEHPMQSAQYSYSTLSGLAF